MNDRGWKFRCRVGDEQGSDARGVVAQRLDEDISAARESGILRELGVEDVKLSWAPWLEVTVTLSDAAAGPDDSKGAIGICHSTLRAVGATRLGVAVEMLTAIHHRDDGGEFYITATGPSET